jgi:hypothetical protein
MEVAKLEVTLERRASARKQRLRHDGARHLRDRALRREVPGPHPKLIGRQIERREERKPYDVVEMAMAEEDVGVHVRRCL